MEPETSKEVTIVVKSPYQIFTDQSISCPCLWTVERLKEEITKLCPSHPSVKEQKLIYWGKLLEDKALLKDTLKIYEEGQANHTVHLVLKNDQTFRGEGVRHRTPTAPPSNPPPQFSPSSNYPPNMWAPAYLNQASYYGPGSPGGFGSGPSLAGFNQGFGGVGAGFGALNQGVDGRAYPQGDMAQQISAMQQAYVQYMHQYMQHMMGGAYPPSTPMGMMGGAYTQAPPNRARPVVADDNPNEGQGEERQRDWLDWFYLSSRTLIFLTIVCFYSSPIRFLLVLGVGFAIYLYQSGFFRYQGGAILIPENNVPLPPNQGVNAPLNNQHNEASRGPPPHNDSTANSRIENLNDENAAGNNRDSLNIDSSNIESRNIDSSNIDSQNRTPLNNASADASPTMPRAEFQSTIPTEERPTLMGLTWTIVANFFTSLLPEQPTIL